jgi:hypothetical protein
VPKSKAKPGEHLVTQHIRIHRQYVERLDALAGDLEASEDFAPSGRLLKQERLRLALRIGIEALENRFGAGKGGG